MSRIFAVASAVFATLVPSLFFFQTRFSVYVGASAFVPFVSRLFLPPSPSHLLPLEEC